MGSLNKKLSELKNKTSIDKTELSTLDLIKLGNKKSEVSETTSASTPNVIQQKPTDEIIIIPSSVGDVVFNETQKQQIIEEIKKEEAEEE